MKIRENRGMTNLRMFAVKFLGPTETQGARIKINDLRTGDVRVINYDYSKSQDYEVAMDFLEARRIPILGHAWDDRTGRSYLLSDNFDISIL